MKNIHVLPTDKPSRLCINGKNGQHIYITSDEEIKEGDWFYDLDTKYIKVKQSWENSHLDFNGKKIILTTDQDLIKDGVQAIDDEFLEWFVKNPSCEEVGIQKQYQYHSSKEFYIDADYVDCTKEQYESIKKEIPTCPLRILYKIIIPKEEPKQETLEEAAKSKYGTGYGAVDSINAFIEGAKWQAERMYSEEEVLELLHERMRYTLGEDYREETTLKWFEQFKKK